MANEPKKLMQIPEAAQASETAYLWTVLNGVDYRVSLAAVLSLITLERLGLENVDNVSDANKPISSAVAAALEHKANVDDVVANSTFDALASRLSLYVTKEELDNILITVWTAINGKFGQAETDQAISGAIAPISLGITQILGRLTNIESGYTTAYVRSSEFATALIELRLALSTEIRTDYLAAIEPIALALDGYSTDLLSLRAEFDAFKIITEQRLTALEETTAGGEALVSIGPNQW